MTLDDAPIRELGPADLAACLDLAQDRDWPREGRKWGRLLEVGRGYGVDAPDGGLAATAILTEAGELAMISMVVVGARFGRQGLGRRLMTHCMDVATARFVVLHATKFGQPLYASLGFEVDGVIQKHTGPLAASGPVGREATEADFAGLYALDRDVSGTDRRQLLERLVVDAEHVHVVEREGAVSGYALGIRSDDDEMTIGPVVAADAGQARELVTGIAAAAGMPVRIDVDTHHQELVGWLQAAGLIVAEPAPRMVLGGKSLPGDGSRRFAPIGPAFA